MPKPMYVWSGSAWVSVATEVESLATYATQSYANNAADVASGMKLLTPTSIAIGSGSGSVGSTGTVTVSAASSVSLNGVFTSTYNNYLVLFGLTGSTAIDLLARLRASGTDNSSANYGRQLIFGDSSLGASTTGSATSWNLGQLYDSDGKRTVLDLMVKDPASSSIYTTGRADSISGANGSPYALKSLFGTTVTTAYDGISFIASSGTISGAVSVYGYKK
jgi:hypothetical protein